MLSIFLPCPKYSDSQRYKDALNWYECWKPNGDVNYEQIKDLATKEYESTEANFSVLDQKAAWLIGLESTLTVAMIGFGERAGFCYITLSPAIVALLLAIWAGLRSRLPVKRPTPMEIVDMIDVQEYSEINEFNGRLAASHHCTVIALQIVTKWKASMMRYSGYLFFFAIAYAAIAGFFR